MMKNKIQFFTRLFALFAILILLLFCITASAAGEAENATTCDTETEKCHITITLRVAFVGADYDYIYRFADEVEEEWNGPPNNPNTYGDCKCPFEVKVLTQKVNDCTSAPQNYHCIEVTNYSTHPPFSANESVIKKAKEGEINPRTSNLVKRHRGYIKPPGVSTGDPLKGWWSDIMSTPLDGQKALDFAHEAGHMMGLDDGEGGIMNKSGVVGPNAGVTQDNINKAVERVCGQNACPDRCCCGNAKIDRDKGENCDPLASPTGCKVGEACCPVCCNCYAPSCDPKYGEYVTKEDCEKDCTGENMICHINYYTGCWDCVEESFTKLFDEYDNSRESIWKANESLFHEKHPTKEEIRLKEIIEEAVEKIGTTPFISTMFANERINIHLQEGVYHAVTIEGEIAEVGVGTIDEPTVNVFGDMETFELIVGGELGLEEALKEGKIRYEGVGFFNSLKFGVIHFLVDLF